MEHGDAVRLRRLARGRGGGLQPDDAREAHRGNLFTGQRYPAKQMAYDARNRVYKLALGEVLGERPGIRPCEFVAPDLLTHQDAHAFLAVDSNIRTPSARRSARFAPGSTTPTGWNVTATAQYLGIPLSTLKYKMDKLDVRELAKRLRGV